MKFTILTYGYEKMDTNGMFANDTIATASNPNCPHRLMDIPIWGILIQTEAHNIIYDLGCMEDCMEKYWSEGQKDRNPFTAEPGGIEGQLAKVGLTCADIDTVIVSHLHSDHFGLITKFPHCDVYVTEEEWITAMKAAFGTSAPRQTPTGPYYYRCMSAPVKRYHFVRRGEDFELYPGLRLITLPGHVENLLGLVVTVDSGKRYLFPSDALYSPLNMGPPLRIPGFCVSTADYRDSLEKIARIQRETGAEIMYSHWMPIFNEWKKAPFFYE